MAVKQKEIAEMLDLSITTVCRSLRGYSDIHPETRKKVINLASKLGYRPRFNSTRRKDASSDKMVSVGAIVCRPEKISRNPSQAAYHMLAGISSAAEKLNISLATHFILGNQCRQLADPENQFTALRAGALSGMVLIYDFPRDAVKEMAGILPCVTLVHPHLDMGVDCIDNDHAEGIGMIMEHLYRLGHRRIGFMMGLDRRPWLFPRFAGYMRALDRLGLPCDPSIIVNALESTLDIEAQGDVVIEQLSSGVTAWVCADDSVGYELYPVVASRGVRIPQDVSLAGFSGLEPPQQDCPRLTSIHPPYEKMGTAAVKQLINRIKHPSEPVCHLQFGCDFIEGATTGPPVKK